MKTLKYFVGIGIVALSFMGCDEVDDDMPPRTVDMQTNFILPAPARLTNAERDIIQAKRDAYAAAIAN